MTTLGTWNFEGTIFDGWDSHQGTGCAIDTTTYWDGTQCAKITASGSITYLQKNIAVKVVVARFYLKMLADTSGTATIFACPNANGNMQLMFRAGRKLRIEAGSTVSADSAALTLGQWYLIDVAFDCSGATATASYQINGAAQTGASHAQTSANMSALRIGNTGTNTYTINVDDALAVDTSASYPLGGVIPAFSGTITGASTATGSEAGTSIRTGTIAGVSTASGAETGAASFSGTIAGTTVAAGSVTGVKHVVPLIAWGGPGLIVTPQEPTPEELRRERERKRRKRREELRVARAVAAAMVALRDQRQKREEEWLLGLASDDAYRQDMTTLRSL